MNAIVFVDGDEIIDFGDQANNNLGEDMSSNIPTDSTGTNNDIINVIMLQYVDKVPS